MPTPPNMSTTNRISEQEAEAFELPMDEHEMSETSEQEVTEHEDGSATIELPEQSGPMANAEFYANMAEDMDEGELDDIASDYMEFIEVDKESRKKRDEQYEDGLRRSGLGHDAPGGATFDGASKVVHPVIAEACVDFSASASKELLPPDGLVKSKIYTVVQEAVEESAQRKVDFMNWQFNNQIAEYRDEMEQLLTQIPLGGSQYLKWKYDTEMRRPSCEWVPIDNIFLPYEASNFYEASRVTEQQDITEDTLKQRIDQGLYRDVDGITETVVDLNELEATKSKNANDKIEGISTPDKNIDGVRRIYEITTFLRLESDKETKGKRAPYILTIDEATEKVLSLRRNWDENDEKLAKLDWMVEFKFIPWRGAYGIGLPHLIGGLSAALTGALRALLDAAHINNSQTLLKLKGGRISGQSDRIEPTQVVEIEGAPGVDDVRKLAMPMPFNAPSNVLFNLLDWLTNAAKGVVTTAEEKIGEVNANAPVGTTQALIEQGSKVASSIHARLHRSQEKTLKILSRINHWYLKDMNNDSGQEIEVRDFANNADITPVSDPNIFSETQRLAQDQAVLQMATTFPQLYDLRKINERLLKRMKVPNINEILPDQQKAKDSNPALENVAMTMGRNAIAFPDQDHIAHLKVHLAFAHDPMYGGNPVIGPQLVGPMLDHVKQHLTMHYLMEVKNVVKNASGQEDPFQLHKEQPLDPDAQEALALAAELVAKSSQQDLGNFQAAINELVQKQQQQAQAQQEAMQDPSAKVLLQTQMAETQRKTQEMQTRFQLDQQKQQLDYQGKIQDMQAKLADLQAKFKQEQDKLANQIALANVNNAAQERIEYIKAGVALNQQQKEAEIAQNANAVQAELDNASNIRAHQVEMALAQQEAAMQAQDADQQHMREAFAREHQAGLDEQAAQADHERQLEQIQAQPQPQQPSGE